MPYKSDIGTAYCTSNPQLENSFLGRIDSSGVSVPVWLTRSTKTEGQRKGKCVKATRASRCRPAAFALMEPALPCSNGSCPGPCADAGRWPCGEQLRSPATPDAESRAVCGDVPRGRAAAGHRRQHRGHAAPGWGRCTTHAAAPLAPLRAAGSREPSAAAGGVTKGRLPGPAMAIQVRCSPC